MQFKDAFSQLSKMVPSDSLTDTSFLLVNFLKLCSAEEDFIQLGQLKVICKYCNLYADFLNAHKVGDKNVAIEVMNDSKILEDHHVSCYSYAYFMYVFLNGLGIATDPVKWIDPRLNDYQDIAFSGNEKTFGTGAYHDDKENFVFEGSTLVKYLGNNSGITVPYGTTAIADAVFSNNKTVEMVVMPSTLISIGKRCFKDCDKLETVIISHSIEEISDSAFEGCAQLSHLMGLTNIKRIGNQAFKGTHVGFAGKTMASLVSIGEEAFMGSTGVRDISFAPSVTQIGKRAFADCHNIATVNLPFIGTSSNERDPFFYDIFGGRPEEFSTNYPHIKKISINGGDIAPRAFKGFSSLVSITIDGSGENLGESAFENCTSLQEVVIKKPVKHIGKAAFRNCPQLTSLSLNFLGTDIPEDCFKDCSSLDVAPLLKNVFSVGPNALSRTIYKAPALPSSLIMINNGAFAFCQFSDGFVLDLHKMVSIGLASFEGANFKDVILDSPVVLPKGTFYSLFARSLDEYNKHPVIERLEVLSSLSPSFLEGYLGIKEVVCSFIDGSVPERVFAASSVEKVVFKTPVKTFEERCFCGCKNLTTVTIPANNGVTELKESAFADCTALKDYDFIANSSKLEKRCLAGDDLTKLSLSKSLTYIGEEAFAGSHMPNCISLVSSHLVIGKKAFIGVSGLTELEFDATILFNTEFSTPAFYTLFAESPEDLAKALPNLHYLRITGGHLAPSMFQGFASLEKAILNIDDDEIPNDCFSDCASLVAMRLKVKPKFIGDHAFAHCQKLERLSFGNNTTVTSTGIGAFADCVSLKDVSFLEPLGIVGDQAFLGCTSFTNLVFGSSATSIGQEALAGCSNLVSLTLPFVGASIDAKDGDALFGYIFSSNRDTNLLEIKQQWGPDHQVSSYIPKSLEEVSITKGDIPAGGFFGCTSLKKISLLNATSVGDMAFCGCSSLESLEIGPSLKNLSFIGLRACPKLSQFVIDPANQYFVFYHGCLYDKPLTTIRYCPPSNTDPDILSTTLKAIAPFAFENNKRPEINLPRTVKLISKKAFFNCALTSVAIPDGTKVENSAFSGCDCLTSISFENDFSGIDENAFIFQKPNPSITSLNIKKLGENSRSLDRIFVNRGAENDSTFPNLAAVKVDNGAVPSFFFAGFPSLKMVTLGPKVTSLCSDAFGGLTLSELSIPSSAKMEKGCLGNAAIDNLTISHFEDGHGLSYFCLNEEAPTNAIKSLSVLTGTIPSRAFANISSLLNVTLGDRVTGIASNAFASSAVEYVSIGQGLCSIDDLSFVDSAVRQLTISDKNACYRMDSVFLESNDKIICCLEKNITSLTVPKNITQLGQAAFCGLKSLASIDLQAPILTLGEKTFDGDDNVQEVAIGSVNIPLGCLFASSNKLTSVTFRGQEIPNSYFANMPNLAAVSFENDITSIGNNAFYGDENLASLFPFAKIQFLGDGAFYGCARLTRLSFAATLQKVGFGVFEGCSMLKELTIPALTKKPDEFTLGSLFGVFPEPRDIPVCPFGEDGPTYYIPDSLEKVTINGGTLVPYFCASFPAEVELAFAPKTIPEGAFASCRVSKVDLSQCTEVGDYAFEDSSIKQALLLKAQKIGSSSFASALSLRELFLGPDLHSIGASAFQNVALEKISIDEKNQDYKLCGGSLLDVKANTLLLFPLLSKDEEVVIPSSVESLPPYFFSHAANLKKVLIEGVKNVGEGLFSHCPKLESVVIPTSLMNMGAGILEDCHSIKEISVPFVGPSRQDIRSLSYLFSVKPMQNENVSDYFVFHLLEGPVNPGLFSRLKGLTKVSLPAGCDTLPDDCFNNCSSLDTIEGFEQVKAIGANCFKGCLLLMELPLETTTIKILPVSSFDNCTHLTIKGLPSQLEKIESGAFKGCAALESIIVPDSVKEIGKDAFVFCSNLTSLEVPFLGSDRAHSEKLSYLVGEPSTEGTLEKVLVREGAIAPECFSDFASLKEISIPAQCQEIPAKAFANCRALVSFVLPNTVTSIGAYAFDHCANLTALPLETLNKLQTIGEGAFNGCASLNEIKLPASLMAIGDKTFAECAALHSFISEAPLAQIGKGAFTGCLSLTDLVIPFIGFSADDPSVLSYLDGSPNPLPALLNVTLLKAKWLIKETFAGHQTLTKVTLPESVTAIGDKAFERCGKLVTISGPIALQKIGASAFAFCESLQEVPVWATLTEVGDYAFESCSSLQMLNFPSLKKMGVGSFEGCCHLSSFVFAATLTNIPEKAFMKDEKLINIALPDNLEKIGPRAFCDCSSLDNLKLPSSLTSVGGFAFLGDAHLTIHVNKKDCDKGWDKHWKRKHRLLFNVKVVVDAEVNKGAQIHG